MHSSPLDPTYRQTDTHTTTVRATSVVIGRIVLLYMEAYVILKLLLQLCFIK